MEMNFNQYRVKTLEELGGRRPHSWNGSGMMDYLYGMELNSEVARKQLGASASIMIMDKRAPSKYWLISTSHIIKKCKIKVEVRS